MMKYIIMFMLCLSVSYAGYDKVEVVKDFIVLDGELAINKRFIISIKKSGDDVVVKYLKFYGFTESHYLSETLTIKNITVTELVYGKWRGK